MGGKNRTRNQSSRRHNKNFRNRVYAQQPRDLKCSQIVAYDADLARRQKLINFQACAVCRKRDYCIKACRRCQLAKCCNDECLRKHRSLDEQCVRNVNFSKARKRIPSHVKEDIFKRGYSEISPHIYSIQRREVYDLMGGPRSVKLLQVILTQVDNTVLVKDIDGFATVLHVYPPGAHLFTNVSWCKLVRLSFPPSTFILLWDCWWNNHSNVHSSAVNIRDFSCITHLENKSRRKTRML